MTATEEHTAGWPAESGSAVLTLTVVPTNGAPVVTVHQPELQIDMSDLPLGITSDIISATDDDLPYDGWLGYYWKCTQRPESDNQVGGIAGPSNILHPEIGFTMPGTYKMALRVTDGMHEVWSDELTITVTQVNQPPQVDIFYQNLATTSAAVLLDKISVTDEDPVSDLNLSWTYTSDSGTAAFQGDALCPTVTFSAPGTYVLTLTAIDTGSLVGSDQVTIEYNSSFNLAPQVDAGEDIEASDLSVTVQASIEDDGLPSGRSILFQWINMDTGEILGGDAFGGAGVTMQQQLTFQTTGTYTLKLRATEYMDDVEYLSGEDIVKISVKNNTAMPLLTVRESNIVDLEIENNLQLEVSDVAIDYKDVLDGSNVDLQWQLWTGPQDPVISNPNVLRPAITFACTGRYVFQLTATPRDGGQASVSYMVVNVVYGSGQLQISTLPYSTAFREQEGYVSTVSDGPENRTADLNYQNGWVVENGIAFVGASVNTVNEAVFNYAALYPGAVIRKAFISDSIHDRVIRCAIEPEAQTRIEIVSNDGACQNVIAGIQFVEADAQTLNVCTLSPGGNYSLASTNAVAREGWVYVKFRINYESGTYDAIVFTKTGQLIEGESRRYEFSENVILQAVDLPMPPVRHDTLSSFVVCGGYDAPGDYYTRLSSVSICADERWNEPELDAGGFLNDSEAAITNPCACENDEITGVVHVTGTIWHPNLIKYQILYCPVDSVEGDPEESEWYVADEGRMPVENGQMGTWDTSPIPNGYYYLGFRVDTGTHFENQGQWQYGWDTSYYIQTKRYTRYEEDGTVGESEETNAVYAVTGELKCNTFTHIEEPDISIAWPGQLPFELCRMYNNSNRFYSRSLPYGWTHNFHITLTEDTNSYCETISDPQSEYEDYPTYDENRIGFGYVWVTYPDGSRHMFKHSNGCWHAENSTDYSYTGQAIYYPYPENINSQEYIVRTTSLTSDAGEIEALTYELHTRQGDVYIFHENYDSLTRTGIVHDGFADGIDTSLDYGNLFGVIEVGLSVYQDRFGNTLEFEWNDEANQKVTSLRHVFWINPDNSLSPYRGITYLDSDHDGVFDGAEFRIGSSADNYTVAERVVYELDMPIFRVKKIGKGVNQDGIFDSLVDKALITEYEYNTPRTLNGEDVLYSGYNLTKISRASQYDMLDSQADTVTEILYDTYGRVEKRMDSIDVGQIKSTEYTYLYLDSGYEDEKLLQTVVTQTVEGETKLEQAAIQNSLGNVFRQYTLLYNWDCSLEQWFIDDCVEVKQTMLEFNDAFNRASPTRVIDIFRTSAQIVYENDYPELLNVAGTEWDLDGFVLNCFAGEPPARPGYWSGEQFCDPSISWDEPTGEYHLSDGDGRLWKSTRLLGIYVPANDETEGNATVTEVFEPGDRCRVTENKYDPATGDLLETRTFLNESEHTLTLMGYNRYGLQKSRTAYQGYRGDGNRVMTLNIYGGPDGDTGDSENGRYLCETRVMVDPQTESDWVSWPAVKMTHHLNGLPETRTDAEGNRTDYVYDAGWNLIKEVARQVGPDQADIVTARKCYDGRNRLVLEAAQLGEVTRYDYDDFGRAYRVRKYRDSQATSRMTFEPAVYDGMAAVEETVAGYDARSRSTYQRRSVHGHDPAAKTQTTYTAHNQPKTVSSYNCIDSAPMFESAPTVSVQYYYNEAGLKVAEQTFDSTQPDNYDRTWVSYTYDGLGRNTGTAWYDYRKLASYNDEDLGDVRACAEVLKCQAVDYFASGKKKEERLYGAPSEADQASRTSYEYDVLDRMVRSTVHMEPPANNTVIQYGYDAVGNLLYKIDPQGNCVFTDYDSAGRKTQEYFAVPHAEAAYAGGVLDYAATKGKAVARTFTTYDKNNQVKSESRYDYGDADGNGVGDALLSFKSFEYDRMQRLVCVFEAIEQDEQGRLIGANTSYAYRNSNAAAFDGGFAEYDICITDGEGKKTWIMLDEQGNRIKTRYPSGPNDTEENDYFGDGSVKTKYAWYQSGADPDIWTRASIDYDYDSFGRRKAAIYPDPEAGAVTYDYTGSGQLQSVTDSRTGSGYTFTYDALGRTESVTDQDNYLTCYEYMPDGQKKSVSVWQGTSPLYQSCFEYDAALRLKTVFKDDTECLSGFTYTPNGNRETLTHYLGRTLTGSLATTTYLYNADNYLTQYVTSGAWGFVFYPPSGTSPVDGLGRLVSGTEVIRTNSVFRFISLDHTYDLRGQLTAAHKSWLNGSPWQMCYQYDLAGNIRQNEKNALEITNYQFSGDLMAGWQVDNQTPVELDWDDYNGRLTRNETSQLTYNLDGRLVSAASSAGTVTLAYDPLGNRVGKVSTVSGISTERRYIVDTVGDLPVILMELDPASGGSLKKSYYYAHAQVMALWDHADPDGDGVFDDLYFYMHDRLGSVRQVIDESAAVMHYYTYDPYGELLESASASNAPANAFLFTGQWYDEEISQYYLRARMYDPALMRFTTRDPVKGQFTDAMTLHAYLYCLNDPINHTDLSGKVIDAVLRAEDAKRCVGGLLLAGLLLSQIDAYNLAVNTIAGGIISDAKDWGISLAHAGRELTDAIVDYYHASRSQQAGKKAAGALAAVVEHMNKMNEYGHGDPGNSQDPNKDWLKHIRKQLREMEKFAERQTEKAAEETKRVVKEIGEQLKELANEHGIPWDW